MDVTIAEIVFGIPEMHQLIVSYVSIGSITRMPLQRNLTNSNLYNFLCVCKCFNAISQYSILTHLQRMNPYQIVRLMRAGKIPAVRYLIAQGNKAGIWDCAYVYYTGVLGANVLVDHKFVIKTTACGLKYPTGFNNIGENEGPCFVRRSDGDCLRLIQPSGGHIDYKIGAFVERFKKFIHEAKIPSCEPYGNILRTRDNCLKKYINPYDTYNDYYDYYLSQYQIMELLVEFFEEYDLVNVVK